MVANRGDQLSQIQNQTVGQIMESLGVPSTIAGREAETNLTNLKSQYYPQEMALKERETATGEANSLTSRLETLYKFMGFDAEQAQKAAHTGYYNALAKGQLKDLEKNVTLALDSLGIPGLSGSTVAGTGDVLDFIQALMTAGSGSSGSSKDQGAGGPLTFDQKKQVRELENSLQNQTAQTPELNAAVNAFNELSDDNYVWVGGTKEGVHWWSSDKPAYQKIYLNDASGKPLQVTLTDGSTRDMTARDLYQLKGTMSVEDFLTSIGVNPNGK